MIDVAVEMDYLATSQKGHSRATKYRNMDESLFEDKVLVAKTRCDLIFDSYINPSTMRHMTIPTVRQHNAMQEAMKKLVGDHTTTDMEIATSSIDKKRFRLPLRDASTIGGSSRSDALQNTDGGHNNLSNDPTPVVVEAMENDESTYTSKRVKRENDSTMRDLSMKEEMWNFLPYPDHKDIDVALNNIYGITISQLLNSWDQNACSDRLEEIVVLRQKDELNEGYMYDVEQSMLDFHVTSDDWNKYSGNILSTTNDNERHHEGQDLNKCDKDQASESSSVSSISFVEQQQVPTPPTLLRVTTSTILEEQELIWRKIKQEQHEPYTMQACNINAFWHHEVTRGHHVRPPLSPRSRRSNLRPPSIPSGLTNEDDVEEPGASPTVSFGFNTPTSEKRKIKGLEPPEPQTIPKSNKSFPADPPFCPVQVTPTKNESVRLPPKSLFAPCFGCQTPLQFPLSTTSSVVYCMNCGIMASTDVMRSCMDDDEGQCFVSFDSE